MLLPFIPHPADVGDRVGFVPTLAGGQATQPIRRAGGSLAQNDGITGYEDIEAITRLDAQFAPSLAWDDDLMLCTDLDA
jgi:hypothetical protein